MIKKIFKKDIPYKIDKDKYIFKKLEVTDINDSLDKLKSKLKKFTKLYSWLINVISPVYNDQYEKNFIDKYISEDKICLNIGSGNSNISDYVYNVDIFVYDNVNVVCDIENLPFKDNSVDIILNIAVLEHVPNPYKVIEEIYRVLKPNGIVYTAFPFMQGFHASPYDFTRVTEEGIKILHKSFHQLEVKPFSGPTSGMLWIVQEWIAILFSFGSKKLHLIIYLFILLLTFPIKYLDYFLINHPMAKNISSGFIFIGRKNASI
ncbi:MAG: class I SAM-dependent methyltransferase [Bacteroidales bacterium]|nr:class I SAM-dependent methyltransferase [Bacteroidales bacterium]